MEVSAPRDGATAGQAALSAQPVIVPPDCESWPRPADAWYVVVILMLAMSLAFVDRYVLSLLVDPIKHTMNISDMEIGLLQGIPFGVFYTIFGIPLGRIADSRNRRNLLTACIFLWSFFTIISGFSKTYLLLFAARIGVATGEAGLPPTTMTLISDYFPKEKRTKPFGLFMCGAHIGGGLALLVGGAVLNVVISSKGVFLPLVGNIEAWRVAFVLVGLPGIVMTLLFFTVKEPQRHDAARRFDVSEVVGYLRTHWKLYGAIFFGVTCIGTVGTAMMAWVPAMLMRVRGLDHQQVGYGLGLAVLIGGVSGALLAGTIEEWLARRGYKNAKLGMAALCALIMLFFAVAGFLSANTTIALVCIGFTMMLFAMPLVLAPAAIMSITPGRLRGQIGATYIVVTGLLGGILGPTSVPLLTDFVFHNEAALNYSLVGVAIVFCPLAALLLSLARRPYLERVDSVE